MTPLQVCVDGVPPAGAKTGCAVEVSGSLVPHHSRPVNEIQCSPEGVRIVGDVCAETYPLQKKRHTLEFLRDIPHLRPRSNTITAATRVRHVMTAALTSWFDEQGYLQVHTPVITVSDCEGAGETFDVVPTADLDGAAGSAAAALSEARSHFFGGAPARLTVSGQLHAEVFASAFSKVYTFGPTFRAENSNTSRHLSEFWMLEPELAFATMDDAMASAQGVVQAVLGAVRERCAPELDFFARFTDSEVWERLGRAADGEFPRVTYTEAVRALQDAHDAAGGEEDKGSASSDLPQRPDWGDDLNSEQERWICARFGGGAPLFVTRYPRSLKPFYMLQEEQAGGEPGEVVGAFDLLVPGIGELIGGSAREHRLQQLLAAMQEAGLLDEEGRAGSLEWYVDLRRYGSVPHAGYGLGFERLLQFATGIANIRDAIAVPRAPGMCKL